MNEPWLSILIPVYNVRPYLADCFRSVLAQVDAGVEIIVLDDQSTDDSLAYLQQLAAISDHPIIILQHDRNRGLSAARNTLVGYARGTYLWFLDSDDILVEGAVAALRSIIQQHTPDLVMCDYEIWKPETQGNHNRKQSYAKSFGGVANTLVENPELLFRGLYQYGKLHAWSKISRRCLWRENNLQFPEGKYFEDMVTIPRLALKVNAFYYCPNAWVKYRQRPGSILASFTPQKINDMLCGLDDILNLWQERIPYMDVRSRYFFIRYCVKIYLFAVKENRRIKGDFQINSPETRARFFQVTGVRYKGLVKHYLLNGDFVRLIKTLKLFA